MCRRHVRDVPLQKNGIFCLTSKRRERRTGQSLPGKEIRNYWVVDKKGVRRARAIVFQRASVKRGKDRKRRASQSKQEEKISKPLIVWEGPAVKSSEEKGERVCSPSLFQEKKDS